MFYQHSANKRIYIFWRCPLNLTRHGQQQISGSTLSHNEDGVGVEVYTGSQRLIKTGIYHQCAITEDRAWGSSGPASVLTCVGFHSVWLKLTRCRWCESERRGWEVNKGERKERANMGGCCFHWALPCAQATVWSCRWWISLCWLADEPWPRVIGLPFVCPLPLQLAPALALYPPLSSARPSPSELLHCEDFLDGERGTPVSLWCSRAQRRGMMLMKLHSLMKSSCGMFWKTKAPAVRRLFSRFSTFPHHAVLEYCFFTKGWGFPFCFIANWCFFTSMA